MRSERQASTKTEKHLAEAPDPIDASESDEGLFVASLAKGMKVLECFDGGRASLSLTEIAARAAIGKSAAQRAVATLHALGYLRKDDQTRYYRIAPKLLGLTRFYSAGQNMVEICLPEIRRCHELTGETVNVTERDDTDIVCIARIPGRHVVTISIGVGFRLPAYATAPGLAMLAFEDPVIAEAILERSDRILFTKQTVTSVPELMTWLGQIRKEGYVIADQLRYEGEYSIAAPIFGAMGGVVGAVNVSAPTTRYSLHELRSRIVPVVVETAMRISTRLRGE